MPEAWMRWAVLVVVAAACSGKSGEDTGSESGTTPPPTGSGITTPPTCGEPSLSVGTGDFSYEPYPATDPKAEIEYGGQGGWHVWVAGDIVGLGPKILQVSKLTLVDTGTVIAGDGDCPITEAADLSVPVATTGLVTPLHGKQTDCGWQFAGAHAFLIDNLGSTGTLWGQIEKLDGMAAQLDVTLYDLDTCTSPTDTADGCRAGPEDVASCAHVSGTANFSLEITENSVPPGE